MIGRIAGAVIVAAAMTMSIAGTAGAGSAYDGSWSLSITTERGNCDRNYYFQVQINNGVVSHPNLVKFRGRVSNSGHARGSVTVMNKHASGSGRLTRTTGRSGSDRCSGFWTAQRG